MLRNKATSKIILGDPSVSSLRKKLYLWLVKVNVSVSIKPSSWDISVVPKVGHDGALF